MKVCIIDLIIPKGVFKEDVIYILTLGFPEIDSEIVLPGFTGCRFIHGQI